MKDTGTATDKPRSVAPYQCVAISPIAYNISKRADINRNLDNIEMLIDGAIGISDINMPVRLVAIPEGALTGFTDEIFDLPHALCADEFFIDIPGAESDRLGKIAKRYDTYIIFQCKARLPEVIENRFFNLLAVIGPNGKVVHKAAKNHVWCRERSCTPHDVYDRWTELFGDGTDAFYPVLKTDDIGNIGTICCSDGEYPEAVRALAMNGAEVVYRPSEAIPMTVSGGGRGGSWLIQNRGHAEFNSLYMVCPNIGPVYVHPKAEFPVNVSGGNSHIIDYRGEVMAHIENNANTMISAIIDIEALRNFRTMNLNSNWMKDLRTELFRHMYDEPVFPKNLWLDREPAHHREADAVYRESIEQLIDRGVWTPPAVKHSGVKYTGEATDEKAWRELARLWEDFV
ncbi:MAG: hydrolase [Clostridiales Family XIII bacterium]|jgi:predicted amidohydrolase|nr:hydrolase [Clostridiales Family XIII bacterium]